MTILHPGPRPLLLAAAVWMIAAPALAGGGAERAAPVTFTKDIAPILQRSCENCHRPRGGAPMSLRFLSRMYARRASPLRV